MQRHRAIIAVCLQVFDEMLQEQECSLAGFDREVLLDFSAFLAAKGRVGKDDVITVTLLHIADIFGQGVGVDYVGPFSPTSADVRHPLIPSEE